MFDLNRLRILDGTTLKLIAIFSMLIDHVGSIFFPEALWMRAVGRIAMPIFAFCIAEGYIYTHDRKRFLTRLAVFAVISELPFDLAFFDGPEASHQNIMLTFFLAVLALMAYDRIRGEAPTRKSSALAPAVVFLMAGLATILGGDYILFGVLSVFLFYALRSQPHWKRQLGGMAFLALTRTIGYYAATGLAVIPLLMYNGKKGRGLKWLFYAFYPGHLLVLWALKRML